jgi:hypothetical protein
VAPPEPDETPGESGKLGTILAIIVLALSCYIAIAVLWVQFSDRANGQDAWREKGVREQRDGYRKACEENSIKFETLKKWLEQKKIDPPPDYLVLKPCVQPDNDTLNKPKETN